MDGEWRLETRIPARLTAAEGRRFAFTVGGAFLVLAAILWWRDRSVPMIVTGVAGMLFVTAGLIVPSRLAPVQRAWMGLAHAISKVTTPIFLGIVYFGLFASFGWVMRRLGRDPLRASKSSQSAWHTRPSDARRSALNHQF